MLAFLYLYLLGSVLQYIPFLHMDVPHPVTICGAHGNVFVMCGTIITLSSQYCSGQKPHGILG